jgi:hypothetical protein
LLNIDNEASAPHLKQGVDLEDVALAVVTCELWVDVATFFRGGAWTPSSS